MHISLKIDLLTEDIVGELEKKQLIHCVKSVRISSFLVICTEYGDLLSKSPYSVRIRENVDQKNCEYGPFPLSNYK